ncbi:amino acid adenylation domain-containing protein [Streptomyces sp. NPDC090798]|uniref:amino acid adenylation domain-containing protein n=1 Tax=Streptomyces sp. NPDC090798 TaxID=3365968 RepID=UPI00381D27D4
MSDAGHGFDDDMQAIAVTGLACRFPGADSAEEFWKLLRDGIDPREEVPRDELRRAGRLERAENRSHVAVRKRFADPALFDAGYFGMTPAEATVTDPQQRFLLETAVHALEDAGLDPAAPPGRIGVYLGVNISDYLLENLLPHPEVIEPLGFHRVLMGNDRGYTATQLAYRLGLTGPALAVDCACSSSLAAVHHACRALLDFEADAVLAGGAAINPNDIGYSYTEGGISSPDAYCRPFSADARGTVFSSGVGLVVLRRLEDALEDGDRVLAVIRASAMNNDGRHKSGYTAPSPQRQAELIAEVHQLAGVTADRVSYVEAHGTGTPLGDPIEVSALTQAFRQTSDGVGYCAIGSVKSNIGHLDAASGIAGLIKTVLALRHRALPPSLGCERTNPHIDFDTSPFRVNTTLRRWTGPEPLLAGVSSFGVGGTNAHVLVEEAPALPAASRQDEVHAVARVLPFSAKSAVSLSLLQDQLLARVRTCGADEARDVAVALASRRTLHPLRRGLLWRGDDEPVVLDAQAVDAAIEDRNPAFVLAQGRLSAEAIDSLLEQQPAFREAVERLSGQSPARAREMAPAALAVVADLGIAAVWAEHGVRPGAVVAAEGHRIAAAVLCGVVAAADVSGVLRGLAGGVEATRALADVVLHPAEIPWYTTDGSEVCAAGRVPDPAVAFGAEAAAPGQRTLPPRVPAVVDVLPLPNRPNLSAALFPEAVTVTAPKEVSAGHEALSASLGLAWVAGLVRDRARLVRAAGRGRFAELPRYPFDRRRYWVEAGHFGTTVRPAVPGPQGDGTAAGLERAALEIFAEALGTTDVSLDDDLFSLGGDSLLATRIVALARARWQRGVPLGSFMEDPTPGRLARLVAASMADEGDRQWQPLPQTAEADDDVPATSLQEGFLFLGEIQGAAEAFNVPVLADLRGQLDVDAMREAVRDLVARHETLRTAFHRRAGRPVQVVVPEVSVELPLVEVEDETSLRAAVAALLDNTIATDRAPLFVAQLLRTGPERHLLVFVVHHLVADATSTGILLSDLYAFYNRRTGGEEPSLPEIRGLAAEHAKAEARWLKSAEADRQLVFWREELADLPTPLELPGDRPRAAQRGYQGAKSVFTLPSATADRVRELAAAESTTPFVVVLTTFAVLLSRICDQGDLVVGCPISGRHRIETRDLIGNFVNTLPIRFRIDENQTFRSLLRDTARRVARSMDHQDLPFEVLARELERAQKDERNDSAVFRVLFNMLNPGSMAPAPPAGLQLRPLPFERATSPYELSLDWWTDDEGAIGGRLIYDTDRFTRAMVAGWQESFGFLLDLLCQTPDTAMDTCAVAPADTAERTAAALAGPVVDVPGLPVHAVFAQQAERHPYRVAVSDGRDTLTYRELARLSGGLADLLASRGVSAGARVGLAMPRDVRLVVALLGVLRAGGTPVAYDLSHPRQRLAAIADHCGPVLTLCTDERDAAFVRELGQPLMFMPALSDVPVRDGAAVGDGVDPACGAYVTYTSGTTGKPKGIHFPHRALTNLIHWETEGHTVARRWLQFASFGFDAAFHETFAALCAGGSLYIVDEETKHDHDTLAEFVNRHRVEKAIVPVSLMQALAARFEQDPTAFASLREIAVTGEQLRLSEAMLGFFERLPDCRLINNYGPAETHVVTSFVFTGPPREWPRYAPIGKPLQNVTLDIVGSRARGTVPWGSVGELVIAGPCVATGYLDDQALTDERFVRLAGGLRAYRSGDRTRLLQSGDIAFLGRADQQVKIRGVRVEIGEIEVVMREDPGLADVALVVRGAEGDRHIDAYLVPVPSSGDVVGRVRNRLREALPAALVPSTFTLVEQLPVNANGKVDPARLPAPGAQPSVARANDGLPEHDDEILSGVLNAFRRILEAPELGPRDDFFDAGGHSLLATRLIHAVRADFGVRLSITDFYQCGTAQRVARLVSSRQVLGASYPDEELPAADADTALPPGLAALVDRPGADRQKTAVYDTGQQLDAARLTAAVAALLERQAALRTRVVGTSDTALAAADAPGAATVTRYELPPHVAPANAAAWLYEQGQRTSIDPRREPLVRVSTLDLPDSPTLLAVTVHLLALDGRGLDHLCRTLGDAYSRPADGCAPDDGFLRYLAWRNRLPGDERTANAAELWRRLLAPLPAAEATGAVRAVEQHRADWQPDPALQQALRARCAQQRTTPFTLHLTAFALALSWSRGTGTVCPAVPLDGRFHQRFEKTVGAFANVVPMPLLLPTEQTLGQVLEGARQVVDQVLAVSAVPYADLAATRPGLAGFLDLPEVFNYARDDDEPVLLGTKPLLDVGPDLMAPERRLHLTVVDNPLAFRVVFRHGGGPGEARVLALYRQALYALVFEPGEYVGALSPTGMAA